MGKLDFFSKLFRASDSLDVPPPAPNPDGKRHSTVMRPPGRMRLSKTPWWAQSPKSPPLSAHLNQQQKRLAKRVTNRVNMGRLGLPEGSRLIGDVGLLLRETVATPDGIANLLADSVGVREYVLRQLPSQTVAQMEAPERAASWFSVLSRISPDSLIESCLRQLAHRALVDDRDNPSAVVESLWQHSIATAAATSHLCRVFKFKRSRLAQTIALLHDLGRAVVYRLAMLEAEEDNPPTEELLVHLCVNLHEEAGLLAAREMRLPDVLSQIIGNHHADIDADDRLAGIRALVQLADQSAIRCGHGDMETQMNSALIGLSCVKHLGITEARAEEILSPIPGIMLAATE